MLIYMQLSFKAVKTEEQNSGKEMCKAKLLIIYSPNREDEAGDPNFLSSKSARYGGD